MKKTALIIFSFILLAAGLSVLSACSIKSPSAKQAPQAVNEIQKENSATTTENNVVATSTAETGPEINGNCPNGFWWCESASKCETSDEGCVHGDLISYWGKDFDSKTFKKDGGCVEDKNGVYCLAAGTWVEFDPKTFKASAGYLMDKNNIYYISNEGDAEKIVGADFKTFKGLKYRYSKDKDYVYFGFNAGAGVVAGADPKTFQVIDSAYAKDASNVYYLGTIIKGENPATFKIIDDNFSQDANSVYDGVVKLEGSDVKTFRVIYSTQRGEKGSSDVSLDKYHVYCNGLVLPDADSKTFGSLNSTSTLGVYSDNNHYWDGQCYLIK